MVYDGHMAAYEQVASVANGISPECLGMAVRLDFPDGSHRHGILVALDPLPAEHPQAGRFRSLAVVRVPSETPDRYAWRS